VETVRCCAIPLVEEWHNCEIRLLPIKGLEACRGGRQGVPRAACVTANNELTVPCRRDGFNTKDVTLQRGYPIARLLGSKVIATNPTELRRLFCGCLVDAASVVW
jgi:hypothetical protein